jgi:hypothetical protein
VSLKTGDQLTLTIHDRADKKKRFMERDESDCLTRRANAVIRSAQNF